MSEQSDSFWDRMSDKETEEYLAQAAARGVTVTESQNLFYITEPGRAYHSAMTNTKRDAARVAYALAVTYR